ncbi:MAG: response regulator [Sneathiellaceae bacterium]
MGRILLIDDDNLVRESLAMHLQDAGHEVVQAADGRAGIDAFRTGRFDLVITDLFMPEVEGIETIRLLRQDNAEVPIVAITGGPSLPAGSGQRAMPDYLRMARALGATDIVQKPFSLRQLIGLVESCLAGDHATDGEGQGG